MHFHSAKWAALHVTILTFYQWGHEVQRGTKTKPLALWVKILFLAALYSSPKLFQMLSNFQKFFTMILSNKFPTKSSLNIPIHLKRVATLPCEICDTALTHSSQQTGFSVPSCTQKQFTSCDLVPPRIKYTGASTVVLVSSSLACS